MKSKKPKKKIGLKFIFLLIMGIMIISSVIAISLSGDNENEVTGKVSMPTPTIKIDYNNIEEQLSKNSLVKALPENSNNLLSFYNVESDGSKVIEKSYILKKGSVKEGKVDNLDLTISINSNYLSSLTNKNFCDIINKAYNNGDVKIDTSLSKVSIAWKFKGMMKYKDCLGF